MSPRLTVLAAFALAACAPSSGMTPAAGGPGASPDGAALYAAHCGVCHGPQGRGDGPAAVYLFPKPRDFTLGKFKVRSTATGERPTDRDLLETLRRGMPGSAMPSFAHLPEEDLRALVGYVKTLAVRTLPDGRTVRLFDDPQPPRVVPVGTEPAATAEKIEQGRRLYVRQGCAACHGETGVGDGPSALTLRDDWGYPAPPNNFTRGLYKGGSSARDLYLRFTTGMNGTPMPSFESSLSDEDRWALAHYIKSLEKGGRSSGPPPGGSLTIHAPYRARLQANPLDPAWQEVPPAAVPLLTLWQRPFAPDVVRVRAAHDGKVLAIRVEWEDPDVDGLTLRPQQFTDAAAVMFPLTDPPGSFTMGEKGRSCNLWHWRFDRQLDQGKFWDMEDVYPGMVSDDYPFSAAPKAHGPIPPASSQDPAFLTALAAGNPAARWVRPSPVEDLNAEGFGTLEPQPPPGQNVRGLGAWAAGAWSVVFWRELGTSDARDIQFRPGRAVPIAFAVWDGRKGDRDGQKCVTTWHTLVLER